MHRWVAVTALCAVAGCKGKANPPPQPTAATGSAEIKHVEEALGNIVATCAEVTGTVEVRRKGQATWEKVAIGAPLRERDWIRTGPGSFVRVRFTDRGYLDVREQTTLLVDTAISVESGSFVGVAEPGAKPLVVKSKDGSEATIASAAGSAPVEFRVTPSGDAALEIAATKGDLTITTKDGARTLGAGKASTVEKGATSEPVSLIEFPRSIAPGIDARFEFVASKPVKLGWQAVKTASGYRVQVAKDTEFRELVLDEDATETTAAFSPASAGIYAWRVAARDKDGRLGEYGFGRRLYLEEEPPRDLLLTPPNGAKMGFSDTYPKVTFSWQGLGDVSQYKLIIGRGDVPTIDPVVTIPTDGQKVEIGSLREGVFHWGVYAVRDGHDQPIFLKAREITIRKQRVKAHTENLWNESH